MALRRARVLAAVLCAVMVLSLAASCQKEPAKPTTPVVSEADKVGGWLTYRSATDLQRPNYLLTGDGPAGAIRAFTLDKLFAMDAKANLVPRLATGYTVSSDGLTYTVTLKQGVKWQDGEAFNADDAVFYATYHKKIVSVDKHSELEYTATKKDDYTVEYKLEEPNSAFPFDLGYVVLPEHIWSKIDPAKWDEISDPASFVGIGPFKFSERKVGEYVKMVRNDTFWDGKPYLDGVVFQVIGDTDSASVAFESGQVNMMGVNYTVFQNLKDKPGFKFQSYPSGNMRVVLMNQTDPRLSDLAVRTALSYCMDRQTMITVNNVKGQVMFSCFTPADTYANAKAADAAAFEFSTEKAIKALEDAGWKLNASGVREKDGKKLDFTMITWIANNPSGVIITDSCKKAGINVTMKTIDTALFVEKVFGDKPDFELGYNGMTMGPDPSGYKGMYSEGTYTTYVNESLVPKFAAFSAATSAADAQKIADEIQLQVTKDRAVLWLYSGESIWGTNSGLNLDGCGMSGLYPSWINIGKAYFEKK